MRCAVCEKESNNKRVCPYCFTPYPKDEAGARSGSHPRVSQQAQPRTSGTSPAAPSPLAAYAQRARDFVMGQSPIVRWTGAGILLVLLLWTFTGNDEPVYESGAVPSNIIATDMQREEAIALIRRTRETALVEDQAGDEVFVSYPAATFPVRQEGQIALAQQYARADEIVTGRKRRIFFYNPNGRVFAQADPVKGVTVVR